MNASDYSCDAGNQQFPPGGSCNRSNGHSLVYLMLAYGFQL